MKLLATILAIAAVGIGCGEESAQEKLAEKQLEQIEKAEEAVEDVPLCTEIVAAAKAGECIDEP